MKESKFIGWVRVIKESKQWQVCFVLFCLILIASIWYWPRQGMSEIQDRTMRSVRAMYDGNTRFLIAHEPDTSLQMAGITEAKLRQVYEKLIRPYLAGWSVEQEFADDPKENSWGCAYLELRHASGRQLQHGTNLQPTDAGPREPCLWHMLNLSWSLRFDGSKMDTVEQVIKRRIRGVQADREFLESIGIQGILNREWTELVHWDEVLQILESRLSPLQGASR
jgi:hypothetical protein